MNMIQENVKEFYLLSDDDKRGLKQLYLHWTGKTKEFVKSFGENTSKQDYLTYKQYCVYRSLKNQVKSMYAPTKSDKYDSPTDEWQHYD